MSSPVQPAVGVEARAAAWRRWAVLGLLTLGVVIAYVDRTNLSVALAVDDFKRFFQLSDRDRGALNSAFFWTYAVLQIPAGWVVDRYGVKFPYAVSYLVWSLTSAATALAQSTSQLFGLRLLLGVGESVATPASVCWVRFHFAEKQRGLAMGLYFSGTKFGPAIGAMAAAGLIGAYGWRAMFVILGIGGLVWLIPWLALAANDGRPQRAAASATDAPLPFRAVLASPVIWGTLVGTFCYMYFVYFCMTWMPAYFVERRNLSLSSMGVYTMFSFGGMATMAVIAGYAADRLIARGHNAVRVRKGFTIAGFLMGSTEVFGAFTDSVPLALFFAVFSLTGLGLTTANYWALTQTLIPGAAVGRIAGIQNCAANLPGVVAPLLTGWLKQTTGSYEAPLQAIWLFLLLGVAAYVFLVREEYAPVPRSAT